MSTIACIRRWISRKPLEIEAWLQRTTNRIWHMGYQMVTWLMTSPDPWRCCEAVRSAILATAWLLVLVVSYILKIMFYISCYPNETIMIRAYELRRRRHERELFLRPTMPIAILYTNNCISLATNFSTSQLLCCLITFCQFIIPGKRMCYVV